MKYQIGDRIILLHSGEEGNIIDFINKQMVMVDVNGVSFLFISTRSTFLILRSSLKKNRLKK